MASHPAPTKFRFGSTGTAILSGDDPFPTAFPRCHGRPAHGAAGARRRFAPAHHPAHERFPFAARTCGRRLAHLPTGCRRRTCCFGGAAARLAGAIPPSGRRPRQRGAIVLLLDAGDQFQGSLFYYRLAWRGGAGGDARARHRGDGGGQPRIRQRPGESREVRRCSPVSGPLRQCGRQRRPGSARQTAPARAAAKGRTEDRRGRADHARSDDRFIPGAAYPLQPARPGPGGFRGGAAGRRRQSGHRTFASGRCRR